jgi:hypothetical protein
MRILRTALLAILVVFACQDLSAASITDHCKTHLQLTDDQFLEQYPIEESVAEILKAPLENSIKARASLVECGRAAIANNVLFEMSEFHLKSEPIAVDDMAALKQKLLVAEQFLNYHLTTDSACNFIINNIGDRFFGAASYRIEEGFASGLIDKDDEAFQAVIEVLRRNKFTPNIPASNSEKFWRHAKEGNWGYIWNRFRTRYLKDTVLALSLALNLLFFLKPVLRFLRKKMALARKNTKEKTALLGTSKNPLC